MVAMHAHVIRKLSMWPGNIQQHWVCSFMMNELAQQLGGTKVVACNSSLLHHLLLMAALC